MHRAVERNIFCLLLLVLPLIATSANAAICARLDGGRAVRRAVLDGATIIISSQGTFANCETMQRAPKVHSMARPVALTIHFETQSAAVPEPDEAALGALMRHAGESRASVEIVAWAFCAGDPSYATRLAFSRAVALRNLLLELGGTVDQLHIRAFGGRRGEDRAEVNFTPPPRAPPPHV